MNDHDIDLILALADGRLSGDEASAAQARIAADPQLQSELEAQRSALAAIQAAGAVEMTAAEREQLHSALTAQLHLQPVPVPVPPRETRTNRWLAPLAGFAAVAAVFVGAVIVLSDGGDDAVDTFGGEIVASETTSSAAAGQPADEPPAAGDAGTEESAGDGTAADLSPTTALAAAPAADAEAPLLVPMLSEPDVDELKAATRELSVGEGLATASVPVDEAAVHECIARLSSLENTSDHWVIGVSDDADAKPLTYVGYTNTATGEEHVASIDTAECLLIDASS